MYDFPSRPDVPAAQTSTTRVHPRYEDITQDGRLTILGIPFTMGPAVWTSLMMHHPAVEVMRRGVIPILTRLTVEGCGEPITVDRALELRGRYRLAHTVDDQGEVDRLLMTGYVEIDGTLRSATGAPPSDTKALAGRICAEHVFTRLFAPPGQRKVLRLEHPDLPAVPPDRVQWRPPELLLEVPAEAERLEPEGLHPDSTLIAFGLSHTDSNQHVNSLVYPNLFEEAALRRFAALGLDTRLMARFADIYYRKPCFAGDRMRILLQVFRYRGQLGASGVFVPDGPEAHLHAARPHCYLQMRFEA